MRKRLFVLALAGVMAAAFAGCGSSTESTTGSSTTGTTAAAQASTADGKENVTENRAGGEEEMIVGGWSVSSMDITDAHKELFKKAQETLTGAVYTPIALLGTQVVAGKNYRFLCYKEASVSELNAEPVYAIVVIYEDLKNNASITEIKDSEVPAPVSGKDVVGAYEASSDLAMNDDATKAFTLATETLTGVEYKAVALLGSQVVAGKNYRILCESKASTGNSETGWAILTVYADLEGHAEVTDIAEMK
ncbi:MAG: hypothetical protein IJM27_09445 [Eubacterium sp.]|nr:hypothetical protein [Eubacterium sp.]